MNATGRPVDGGRKAERLGRLPPNWVPEYFAIGSELISGWLSPVEGLRDWLSDGSGRILLHGLEDGSHDGLIVRSSGASETLRDRGLYQSHRCGSSADDVVAAAQRIWNDADLVARTPPSELPLIVQRFVLPVVAGHLSNERRVHWRSRDWLCELSWPPRSKRARYRLRVSRASDFHDAPLWCSAEDELEAQLRVAASALTGNRLRYHCEWLWDGQRLWLVQADSERPRRRPAPGSRCPPAPSEPLPHELSAFRSFGQGDERWPKLRCVRTFQQCGLPTTRFLLLEGTVVAALAGGEVPARLQEDLALLATQNLVVRTDLATGKRSAELMLPRTSVCTSADEIEGFLVESSRALTEGGAKADEILFLAHRFLAARASAWSLATPQHARVHIDSTWGLPDGLMYYPHDSFEIDAGSGELVSRRLRCKEVYLDSDQQGLWAGRVAGTGWDWKPSLTDAQAVAIAQQSKRIAQHLGTPVEIMFFVDFLHEPELGLVLPWFFSQELALESTPTRTDAHFAHEPLYIRDDEDVADLRRAIGLGRARPASALRVRPSEDAVRSKEFVAGVAALAKSMRCPIELEGSLLAHFYYELSRADVAVRAVDILEPVERRQSFRKLVRDLIPVRIEGRGEAVRAHRASHDELLPLLKAKAIEEALELLAAADKDAQLEEVADVLEVLRAICAVHGEDLEHALEIAEAKRRERGGFEQGVVLLETTESSVTSSLGSVDQLFPGSASGVAKDALGRRRPNELYPRPRWIPRRLTLPLIPPERGRPREMTVALPSGERLIVTYGEKVVTVDVTPRDRESGHPGQLDLGL